jgi:hypothetical protein
MQELIGNELYAVCFVSVASCSCLPFFREGSQLYPKMLFIPEVQLARYPFFQSSTEFFPPYLINLQWH